MDLTKLSNEQLMYVLDMDCRATVVHPNCKEIAKMYDDAKIELARRLASFKGVEQ